MRYLLSGLLILAAAVALVTAGSDNLVRAPQERTSSYEDPTGYGEAIAEVVVTAERPAWVMPEVVVRANLMTEVVAHASAAPVILSALPSALYVN